MRPIPRAMLPHHATLSRAPEDAYGDETPTPLAELTRVCVEVDEAASHTDGNTRGGKTALLVYDARHSRPAGVTFSPGQRVLFQGAAYRVETVEPLYAAGRLHHVEVGLSG